MSKRKGVSASEKRSRLLSVYHSSGSVYTLNEIEKEGIKVGIVRSAVLDTNQHLIDDGQVETEKIGSTGYCWSFPSKIAQDVVRQSQEIIDVVEAKKQSIEQLHKNIEIATVSRSQNPDRKKNLEIFNKLNQDISSLEGQLILLKENDPVEIAKQEANIELCKASANRWTDNISQLLSWLIREKGLTTKEAKETLKGMGVSTSLEYVGE
mmetsp:Transcript_5873/g.7623  ORF Transcript_5873/g.7623 Transcript_5873/m.7623 type:complete len:209 (-) Transcript_5873:258-884(-)